MRYLRPLSFIALGVFFVLSGSFQDVYAAEQLYGTRYCDQEGYYCIKIMKTRKRRIKTEAGKTIKLGRYSIVNLSDNETTYSNKRPSWKSLWPDEREREIVQKLNRLNVRPPRKKPIAVPSDMTGKTFMDYSPLPREMDTGGEKLIIYDPGELAWGAYDENGHLIKWGPGVGGKSYCPDTGRSCRTVVGDDFKIVSKAGPNRRSDRYPPPRGGAPMPYYMPFYGSNYGFHGSPNVVGKHASHGCVRMFTPDAKWMNKEFAEKGTRVIVKPYPDQKQAVLFKADSD